MSITRTNNHDQNRQTKTNSPSAGTAVYPPRASPDVSWAAAPADGRGCLRAGIRPGNASTATRAGEDSSRATAAPARALEIMSEKMKKTNERRTEDRRPLNTKHQAARNSLRRLCSGIWGKGAHREAGCRPFFAGGADVASSARQSRQLGGEEKRRSI